MVELFTNSSAIRIWDSTVVEALSYRNRYGGEKLNKTSAVTGAEDLTQF